MSLFKSQIPIIVKLVFILFWARPIHTCDVYELRNQSHFTHLILLTHIVVYKLPVRVSVTKVSARARNVTLVIVDRKSHASSIYHDLK